MPSPRTITRAPPRWRSWAWSVNGFELLQRSRVVDLVQFHLRGCARRARVHHFGAKRRLANRSHDPTSLIEET
jgi:hypothetical protein